MSEPEGPRSLCDGRYVVDRPLGRGGMATVFAARDTVLGVERAVKVMAADAARSRSMRSRFLAEAQAMARLDHPNIPRVFDFGEEDGFYFFVTELLPHGSAMDALEDGGPMAPSRALEVTFDVLKALAAAHLASIVHRDVKPQNVLLGPGGARLTDFGIARVDASDQAHRTRTGVTMGTLGYMAPEQRDDAHRVTEAADIFAAGGTLFALCTATHPPDLFASDVDPGLLGALHPVVRPIVARATRYDPAERYPDARAMAVDVARARDVLAARAGEAAPGPTWMKTFDELVTTRPPTSAPAATTWEPPPSTPGYTFRLDDGASTPKIPTPAPASPATAPTREPAPHRGHRGLWAGLGALGLIAAAVAGWAALRPAGDASACAGVWEGLVGEGAPLTVTLVAGARGAVTGEVATRTLGGGTQRLAVRGQCGSGGALSLEEVEDVPDRGRYDGTVDGDRLSGTFRPIGGGSASPVSLVRTEGRP